MVIRKRNILLYRFIQEIKIYYSKTIATRTDKTLQLNVQTNIDENFLFSTDEIRLRQVFDNLIGNAIKFTQEGFITIEVIKTEEYIQFKISDTGIGIALEEQNTIFERFMQAEHRNNVNYGGTGLGLAISKNLIDLLGGKLEVISTVGKGSTFHFKLPQN
jgi:signal transduction histidine kinase